MNINTAPPLALGHLALHFARPEDGPLAAKLLTLLGLHPDEPLPLPDGTKFYRFWTDKRDGSNHGIMYLSYLPEPIRNLHQAIRQKLRVGEADEDPAVAAFQRAETFDPEMCFHVGILFNSLEDLEERIAAVTSDPQLKDRLTVTMNRARRGDEDVDARLDESPLFGSVDRFAYGRNGVQVFVVSDLVSGGPLGEKMTLEIDYVFPNKPVNIFTAVEF
jgi:hypothetical protein